MIRRNLIALGVLVALCASSRAPSQEAPLKDPYIAFEYDVRTNFGLLVLKDPRGKPVKKQITFDTMGQTNGTLVRIDGKDVEYGTDAGKFLEQGKEDQNPSKSVWAAGKVEVTQILEIKPGKSGKLDTLLVRYVLENKDTRPHSVGIRVMIDSAIGTPENDGVPFRHAGGSELITTFKDFPEGTVPEWVEALEKPNEKDPGTTTVMTLKVGGGLDAPSRASITLWPGAAPAAWEIPLESFSPEGGRKDSGLVLYWKPAELKPGQKRSLGYGYGTQDKPSDSKLLPGTVTGSRVPRDGGGSGAGKVSTAGGGGGEDAAAVAAAGKPPLPQSNATAGRPEPKDDGLGKLPQQPALPPATDLLPEEDLAISGMRFPWYYLLLLVLALLLLLWAMRRRRDRSPPSQVVS